MAIAESVANAANLLKVLYPDGVSIPVYEKSKIIGTMKKDNEFFGVGAKYVVVSIAPGAGGSASIASAIGNQGATKEVKFTLGRKKLYEVGSIDGELIASGRTSKGALVDVVKHAMDRARTAYSRSEATAVWGTGGGARGVIASGSNLTTSTITLTNLADAAKFFAGMWIQVAVDDGSSSAPAGCSVNQAQITSITRATAGVATITISGNWNQFAGIATGWFIFRSGDYSLYPNGVPGWAPSADPISTDSFLGVNRFTAGDLNYLSGFRYNGSGQAKSQSLIDAGALAHLNGLDVTTVFLNPLDLRDAFKEQSTYKTIEVSTDSPKVGYQGIQLVTAIGSITALSETDVPQGKFWVLNPNTWTRRSAGDVPMILDNDNVGLFLRSPTDDSYQFRFGGYFNYENADPSQAICGTF